MKKLLLLFIVPLIIVFAAGCIGTGNIHSTVTGGTPNPNSGTGHSISSMPFTTNHTSGGIHEKGFTYYGLETIIENNTENIIPVSGTENILVDSSATTVNTETYLVYTVDGSKTFFVDTANSVARIQITIDGKISIYNITYTYSS